jgi:ABC-type multidrug transport system permease subunit
VVPPADHWLALTALFAATAFGASGLGAILGTLLRGTRNIAMASSILATYLFFLGGGFTTIAFLPQWLRDISAFNPIRYAIDGMRQALFYPDLTGFSTDLAVLVGTALLAVLIGSLVVRRSWSIR